MGMALYSTRKGLICWKVPHRCAIAYTGWLATAAPVTIGRHTGTLPETTRLDDFT